MAERRWRLRGWEWGFEDEPSLSMEFDDGEKKHISLDIYSDYEDVFENPEDLPSLWWKLMDESCEDCEAHFGEKEQYSLKEYNPCRWRPQSELDALYEHAKHNKLFRWSE